MLNTQISRGRTSLVTRGAAGACIGIAAALLAGCVMDSVDDLSLNDDELARDRNDELALDDFAPGRVAADDLAILSPDEIEDSWADAALATAGDVAGKADDDTDDATKGLIVEPPSKYMAVFRQDSGHQYVIDLEWSDFVSAWSTKSNQGLRLIDIETYIRGGVRRYSGVFEPGSGGHYLWVGVTWSSFVQKWNELSAQGQRLVDFETYMSGSQRVYTGVWRAGNDGHYLWVGASWSSFVQKWTELAGYGLRLIDIEVYQSGSQLYYSGVWRQGTGGYALWVGASWNSFASKWMELSSQGQRLVDIEAYTYDGRRLYAGVFRAGSGAYDLVGASSSTVLAQKIQSLAWEGKQPVQIEHEYGEDMPPPGLAAVFDEVMDGHAMGYSYAVAENSTITSSGGFGYARAAWELISPSVEMTGTKRSQIASVSKPITAVAVMNLLESSRFYDINTPFLDIVGGQLSSPATGVENVTIRDLLRHRSGMAAWGYCGPNLLTSMNQLVSQPMVGTPGSTYQYSNGNFCLLRMVVEALSGTNYVSYVQNSILAPMGIYGMSCKPDTSAPTLYYKYGVATYGWLWTDDYTGHCAAYGWYASARDLARFLVGVRGNTVLSSTTKSTMLTQGLGWFTASTVSGTGYHHNGAWITGDGRGYNGAIIQLPGGVDAVVLVNTNGYLDTNGDGDGDTDYFQTVGSLVDGFNNMQSY